MTSKLLTTGETNGGLGIFFACFVIAFMLGLTCVFQEKYAPPPQKKTKFGQNNPDTFTLMTLWELLTIK